MNYEIILDKYNSEKEINLIDVFYILFLKIVIYNKKIRSFRTFRK